MSPWTFSEQGPWQSWGIHHSGCFQSKYARWWDSERITKKIRSAEKALEVAINIEIGIQNQLKMSGRAAHQTTNEVTNMSINNIQSSGNRSRPSTSNFFKTTMCSNCGYGWSATNHKITLLAEKTAKTVELQIVLQKYLERLNNK